MLAAVSNRGVNVRKAAALVIGAIILLSASVYLGMRTHGQASDQPTSLAVFSFVEAKVYHVNDTVNLTVYVFDNGTRVTADFVNVTITNTTGGSENVTLTETTTGIYTGSFVINDTMVISNNVMIDVNVSRGNDTATDIIIIPIGKELAIPQSLSETIVILPQTGSKGFFLPGETANITVNVFQSDILTNVSSVTINVTREGQSPQTLSESNLSTGKYHATYNIPSSINKNETITVTAEARLGNATTLKSDYIIVKPLIVWEHLVDRNDTHAIVEIGVAGPYGQPIQNATVDLTYFNMTSNFGTLTDTTDITGVANFTLSMNGTGTLFFNGNATKGTIKQGFSGLVDDNTPQIMSLPGRFSVISTDLQSSYMPGDTATRHYDVTTNGTPYINKTVSYYVVDHPFPSSQIATHNGTIIKFGNTTTNATGGMTITFAIPSSTSVGSEIIVYFQAGLPPEPTDVKVDGDDGLFYDRTQMDVITIVNQTPTLMHAGNITISVDQVRLGGNTTVTASIIGGEGQYSNAFAMWSINNTNVARLWSEISTVPTPRSPMRNNNGTFTANLSIPVFLPDTPYVITVVMFNDLETNFIFNSTTLNVGQGTGPSLSHMTVTVIPEMETIKGGNSTNVTVIVLSDSSEVDGASLAINSTNGTVSPTTGVTNSTGRFVFTYTAPSATANMTAIITVNATKDGFYNATGNATLNITTLETIPINITLENATINSNSTVNITVTSIPGAQINMSTAQGLGTFAPESGTINMDGTFNTTYRSPRVESLTIVTIRATASLANNVTTTRTAELTVNPPPQLIITITRGNASIGSGNSTYFLVQVQAPTDSGNMTNVTGALVVATSDVGGTFSPTTGTTNDTGMVNFTYTAPVVTVQTTATLSFNASSADYRFTVATSTVVIVPPGVSPNFLTVELAADRTAIFANETVTITATVTQDGSPVEGANVTFSAPSGTFTTLTVTTNASGQAQTTFQTPNVATSQTIQITANATKNGTSPGQGTLQINVQPGTGLEKLTVTITAKSKTLESEASTKLTIKVTSPNGTPVQGATVTISAPSGKLTNTTGITDSTGTVTTSFKAPKVSSSKKVQVTASASKEGFRQGTNSVNITVNPKPSPGFELVFVVTAISIIAVAVAIRRRFA